MTFKNRKVLREQLDIIRKALDEVDMEILEMRHNGFIYTLDTRYLQAARGHLSCAIAELQNAVVGTETIEEKISRLQRSGHLDPMCLGCREAYDAIRAGRPRPDGPSHRPSPSCQSGKHPHCSCDTCF
jgi:hypothetical protein